VGEVTYDFFTVGAPIRKRERKTGTGEEVPAEVWTAELSLQEEAKLGGISSAFSPPPVRLQSYRLIIAMGASNMSNEEKG